MKLCLASLGTYIAIIIGLVACNFNRPDSAGENSPARSNSQTIETVVSGTPTADTLGCAGASTPTITTITSPAIEEIREVEKRMLGGQRPISKKDWEQTGKSISDAQWKELECYYSTLVGKKIIGWRGWVGDIQPYNTSAATYIMSIFMDDPNTKGGDKDGIDVYLMAISEDQIHDLDISKNPNLRQGPYQAVEFSGTISLVVYPSRIDLVDSTVAINDH